MSDIQITDEMIKTLTPEEIAAINDYGQNDLDILESLAEEQEEDIAQTTEEPTDEVEQEAVETGEIAGKEEEKPAESEEKPAVEQLGKRTTSNKPYESDLPSDYDLQLKAIKEDDSRIRQRYKDGEIDMDERDDLLGKLTEEREKLLVAKVKAEISQEMAAQAEAKTWEVLVDNFITKTAKEPGGINYDKDLAKADDLDMFVRVLGSNPQNNDKDPEWFLAEAHRRVLALHGQPIGKNTNVTVKGKSRPVVAEDYQTLAQVPGTINADDIGGEFAYLDSMKGWDFENAIAKMTKEQRARLESAK